jgi:hypothetical protein
MIAFDKLLSTLAIVPTSVASSNWWKEESSRDKKRSDEQDGGCEYCALVQCVFGRTLVPPFAPNVQNSRQ